MVPFLPNVLLATFPTVMGFHASVNTFKLPELQPACHTGPALVLVPISPVSPPGPREEKKKSLFWFKCDKQ